MKKFLVRSLGITLLVQLHSTSAQALLNTPPTATNPCALNPKSYTQADVTSAQSELELRQNHLRRVQNLAKAGVLPRTELDDAVHQERIAQIRLKLAQTATSPRTQVSQVEAMAQLSQTQAELELRHLELQRLQFLAREGAISRSELLEAQQAEQRARANLESARACLRKLIR